MEIPMLDDKNKNSQGFALNPHPAAWEVAGRDEGRSLSIRTRMSKAERISPMGRALLILLKVASAELTGSALRRPIDPNSRFALF